VNTAATEIWYDGTDGDCDGASDYDADSDGFDSDSYSGTDCDDSRAAVNTDASETCATLYDDDCDGTANELDATSCTTYYADTDEDGYGDSADSACYCSTTGSYTTTNSTDCDDIDAAVSPAATETSGDGTDQDCDGYDADYSSEDLVAGDLVITEVMQNPDAVLDTVGEWLEIVVQFSDGDIDLKGLTISDDNGTSQVTEITDYTVVSQGDYLVIGASDDISINGGAPVDVSWGGGTDLANGTDGVELTTPAGDVIDEVIWDSGATFPDPTGASMNLDTSAIDDTSNDDGTNWCETSSSTYGDGDYGTPGADNEVCP